MGRGETGESDQAEGVARMKMRRVVGALLFSLSPPCQAPPSPPRPRPPPTRTPTPRPPSLCGARVLSNQEV